MSKIEWEKANLDKDFRELIPYINENGLRTFACCDGVYSHHDIKDLPNSAYIAFITSDKVKKLFSAFLMDKDVFSIYITSPKSPLDNIVYDQEVLGNTYAVYFENSDGRYTSMPQITNNSQEQSLPYFSKILSGIINDTIQNIPKENIDLIKKLDEAVYTPDDSRLSFRIAIPDKYKNYMHKQGKINSLEIASKFDPHFINCQDLLKKILNDPRLSNNDFIKNLVVKGFLLDYPEDSFKEDEFAILNEDSSGLSIYFKDENLDDILEIINIIKSLEPSIKLCETQPEPDYDSIYDDYANYNYDFE